MLLYNYYTEPKSHYEYFDGVVTVVVKGVVLIECTQVTNWCVDITISLEV